ncbi:hypothetical protein IE53DRAFT_344423 [Violaceomyces palustris]|uniref:Uncharacterized protein n=1 Tax=Violaceomyces palustris TaxID=1673888 RepID=A0ACD0NWW5_9BASI|nr:hypothetical protein IE53DRAFT_344423 [Violaceomyces palustris]
MSTPTFSSDLLSPTQASPSRIKSQASVLDSTELPPSKKVKLEHNVAEQPASPASAKPEVGTKNVEPENTSRDPHRPKGHSPGPSRSHIQSASQDGGQEKFDSLVDVMGSAGVDLQAEEEAIQQRELLENSASTANQAEGRSQGDELYLQVYPLAFKVHTIAQKHGLGVDAAVLNYISLATRTRFRNLIEAMITSSRHRSWSSHHHPAPTFRNGGPMYEEVIRSDPQRQLAALERAEKGDEVIRRRARAERDESLSSPSSSFLLDGSSADQGVDGGFSTPRGGMDEKKKLKRMGPGVLARNLSDDVRKRLADSTAMRNLGGSTSKYSWLQTGATFGGSFSSPLQSKGKFKTNGGGLTSGDGDTTPTPNRVVSLPKPKFAPQAPAPKGGDSDLGSVGQGPLTRPAEGPEAGAGQTTSTPGAWGDVSARQAAKEEEDKKARLRVTIRDALFALEYERSAGVGRGSGESILYKNRVNPSNVN